MYIDMAREIHVMASCSHENIVRFWTSFVYKTELWIVMDLLDGGSIRQIIEKRIRDKHDWFNGVLEEREIATIIRETLKGLEYLRKKILMEKFEKINEMNESRLTTIHSSRH